MEVSQPLDHITHAVIGGGKTMDFGISNSAEFFDILSRTLYTDQELAVVREVLCNAWDAHIDAGCTDRAIEITLDRQNFIVRDFGYGIPHDKIGPIYGVYGASTKKDDPNSTGGFGLGCKAPFAYTDHFEVISYNGGAKTVYNMSKSNAVAKGKPGIITIVRLPSTEQGLQVKMPIQAADYQRFQELIKRIVGNGEMKATLNGEGPLPVIPFSTMPHGFLITKRAVMGLQSSKLVHVRYGNVIYPVESNDVIQEGYKAVTKVLKKFENQNNHNAYSIVLQAPPNSISVTPSRESLSMQEHTVVTLKKLFKNFLAYSKPLLKETKELSRQRVDETVAKKDFHKLFNNNWGFSGTGLHDNLTDISDLSTMARFQLTRPYPSSNLQFRLSDVDYRIRKAAEAKILNPELSASFLAQLPKVKSLPEKYRREHGENRSDWLHRKILGKIMVKLRDAGLDESGLMIMDMMDPNRLHASSKFIPVRQVFGRNHLINMPYLRKVMVLATSMTGLEGRINAYNHSTHAQLTDGLLCYHVRSRKAGAADPVHALFIKLGYEVIDLTKRQTWEPEPRPAAPRKKPQAYPGLPALNTIIDKGRGIDVQAYRHEGVILTPEPELAMVIGARNHCSYQIDGFERMATRALIRLYGDRIGIAADQIQLKRAIKNGAVNYLPVLEQELMDVMLNSANIREYLMFDIERVHTYMDKWGNGYCRNQSHTQMLRLIYSDKDLRKEFGLLDNMTDDERAMVSIFNHCRILSDDCVKTICNYIATIPVSKQNKIAIKSCNKQGNDMLEVLDINHLKIGLNEQKRPIYLDILIKVLKG